MSQLNKIKELVKAKKWFSVTIAKDLASKNKTYDSYNFRFHGEECSKTTPGYYCGNWWSSMYLEDLENLILKEKWIITNMEID